MYIPCTSGSIVNYLHYNYRRPYFVLFGQIRSFSYRDNSCYWIYWQFSLLDWMFNLTYMYVGMTGVDICAITVSSQYLYQVGLIFVIWQINWNHGTALVYYWDRAVIERGLKWMTHDTSSEDNVRHFGRVSLSSHCLSLAEGFILGCLDPVCL